MLARRFLRSQDASIAVPGALVLMSLVGVAALAVDVGSLLGERRRLQTAADLASIAAASDIPNATAAARATVGQNAVAEDALSSLEYGRYTADTALPTGARFVAGSATSSNAVRVTLDRSVPTFFGKVLGGRERIQIRTQATSARTAFASFAIGSRLAGINSGLLNGVLSSLFGTSIALSVTDYDALLSGQIDLLSFSNALGRRVGFTAGSYDSLFETKQRPSDILAAMAEATSTSAASQALGAIGRSFPAAAPAIPLSKLTSFGPYGGLAVGAQTALGMGLAVSAFDLVAAVAQMANGSQQVSLSLTTGLPTGLASASLRVALGSRAAGTSWVTVGQEGATVTTAQTRVLLTVQIASAGTLGLLTVPIYLELAGGSATLKSLTCGSPDIAASRAVLSVRPSLVDAWIGDVGTSDFYSLGRAPNPGPATIGSLPPLYSVTARSHVALTNLSDTDLSFSYADIQSRTKKTTVTSNYLSSLVANLLGSTTLGVQTLGFGVSVPGTLSQSVAGALTGAASPIDQLLSDVLSSLGIGLGQADTWVTGLRCDGAVLVN